MSKPRKPVTKIDPAEFVAERARQNNNATKAVQVLDPGASYGVAAVKATRLLKNDKVQRLLQKRSTRYFNNLDELADNAKSETVRAQVNQDLLDRAGLGKVNKSVSANINIDTLVNELE